MNATRTISAISLVMLLGACASHPDKLASAYVSPTQFSGYDCEQISAEMQRLSGRVQDLHGQLATTADKDKAVMAVGMVLFWPALFALEGGDGPRAAEYSRLKGEYQALEQAATQKKCSFERPGIRPPAQDADGKGGRDFDEVS